MFMKNVLVGTKNPSKVQNSFPHLLSDPLPEKRMWARPYNLMHKNVTDALEAICYIYFNYCHLTVH